MTNDDLAEAVAKLQYHVEILAQTVDYEKHPVEALILERNWSREDLDRAHDIFERWDKRIDSGEKMNTAEFERDFQNELNVSYQGLKSIILAFWRNYQWTNVCEAYVDAFDGSPAVEYHAIMRRDRRQ